MDNNMILSIVAVIGSVLSIVCGVINHKRLRSNCNGNEIVASLDIDNTTPPKKELEQIKEERKQDLTIKVPQSVRFNN
jgi:hypothetical protein